VRTHGPWRSVGEQIAYKLAVRNIKEFPVDVSPAPTVQTPEITQGLFDFPVLISAQSRSAIKNLAHILNYPVKGLPVRRPLEVHNGNRKIGQPLVRQLRMNLGRNRSRPGGVFLTN